MTDQRLNKVRLLELKRWRRDVIDEFERWPWFYTSQWFINQMEQFEERISKLEGREPTHVFQYRVNPTAQ